ncbi:unannotated protein [freshwater metagenome]|uniref:Unannotated protein n=1 Tax=freshwater metagenome TaxID=449393 RepID=A0A6J7ESK4_9ZZZZ|nr:hypothetical protein [Actinomycetota bacterium]
METTPRLPVAELTVPGPNAEAAAFFSALRSAQTLFLDAFAQAQVGVGDHAGQLAHVAAVQGRLTRQFFDAQRALILRRAEIDAEVALIDEAFEFEASDGVAAERQLALLLDDWWSAEQEQGRVMVDHAHARAAIGQLVAPASVLPFELDEALHDADSTDLYRLLTALSDSLDTRPVADVPAVVERSNDLVVRGDQMDDAAGPVDATPVDQHLGFWPLASGASDPVGRWRWIPVNVVVPMMAVTCVLTLALAWIG